MPDIEVIHTQTFCALCVSRCGARATTIDGEFVALEPDPTHPTGHARCLKGKAAPEITRHPDRLLHPLRRTRSKASPDPGWERISWDEALDTIAGRLSTLAREHGAESVAFSTSSPSTSALSDTVDWVARLRRAFGSPNQCVYMELCGWGRYQAPLYTFGAPVPGVYMPDLERAGCILFWGYNPSVARLAHATSTVAAVARGARLVVVDPRRAGLASKAQHWLQVRPGTDGALALSLIDVMIENDWYDAEFVRQWTNAPHLVRSDTGRLLRARDLSATADPAALVAFDLQRGVPVEYSPSAGRYAVDAVDAVDTAHLALRGQFDVDTQAGPVRCLPVLEVVARASHQLEPGAAERVTGVPADQIVATAETLWRSRPVAFYAWSGLEQHGNVSQTIRAIDILYALTGSIDRPGGNVLFTPVPTNAIDGAALLPAGQRAKTLGVGTRPLGPSRFEFVTGEALVASVLEGEPYRVRGLVNFGANLTMAHGDSARVREALAALEFFVHADLFLNPTAELADIVLPVTSAFEAEGLRVGFEVSQEAQSLVQLRRPVSRPRGEARSDLQIVFALATGLGLGQHFWDGDVDAGLRHQLEPSGVTLEQLRAEPGGVRVPLVTRHEKHAQRDDDRPRGFGTPSRKVELFSDVLAEHGYAPVPGFVEPSLSPVSRPDLAERFPLVLTCAKSLFFCETQHRNVAALRKSAQDPPVELNPVTARARGIAAGDWVRVSTPHGDIRARARLNSNLAPDVVCAQHGWWQACEELGLPGYPPFGAGDEELSANLNLVLRQGPSDPISGSSPLRATLCDVAPLEPALQDSAHGTQPIE
jgi:anaerobic selenocysteine-containing dehydrogenase